MSENFYPHGSGAEFATYLYVNLLKEAGHNVVVLTNKFVGEPAFSKSENLTIYRTRLFEQDVSLKYSASMRFDLLLSGATKKLFKWADLVYVPRFWYSAIPLAKMHRKPVVVHLHDYIPICPLSNDYDVSHGCVCDRQRLFCPPKCIYGYGRHFGAALKNVLLSTVLNSTIGSSFGRLSLLSDAVICVSRAQRDIIIQSQPSLSEKTSVIHNPFSEHSSVEFDSDEFGYFGGPDYLKGFRTLYKSMVKIEKRKMQIKVHATKFLYSGEKQARSLSSLGFLLHGKLDNNEYEKLYRQIKSVIIPSIWQEPWPYVVVEAIIKGRFIIASRVGGIPEQVEGCKGALLCEPKNSEQLVEAMGFVKNLTNEEIVELGTQSRQVFLKKFNNETTLQSFVKVCENLICA